MFFLCALIVSNSSRHVCDCFFLGTGFMMMEASPPSGFMNTSDEPSSLFHLPSHLFAILFCYLVGTLGLSVFFVVPILLLLWLHWDERCRLFQWVTELKTEQKIMRINVVRSGESVNWLNKTVDKW